MAKREIFRRKVVIFNNLSLHYGVKYSILMLSIVVSVPAFCE